MHVWGLHHSESKVHTHCARGKRFVDGIRIGINKHEDHEPLPAPRVVLTLDDDRLERSIEQEVRAGVDGHQKRRDRRCLFLTRLAHTHVHSHDALLAARGLQNSKLIRSRFANFEHAGSRGGRQLNSICETHPDPAFPFKASEAQCAVGLERAHTGHVVSA